MSPREREAWLIISQSEAFLITDGRYIEPARKLKTGFEIIELGVKQSVNKDIFPKILRELKAKNLVMISVLENLRDVLMDDKDLIGAEKRIYGVMAETALGFCDRVDRLEGLTDEEKDKELNEMAEAVRALGRVAKKAEKLLEGE